MTGRQRPVAGRQRAVLVALRSDPTGLRATAKALDEMARAGLDLVGIVDPSDHLSALRMILDGVADIVVVTRPDHMPAVRFAGEAAWHAEKKAPAAVSGVRRQTRPTLRAELAVEGVTTDTDTDSPTGVGDSPTPPVAGVGRHEKRTQLLPRGDRHEEPVAIRSKRTPPFRRSA